jgi:four helix bundle protein
LEIEKTYWKSQAFRLGGGQRPKKLTLKADRSPGGAVVKDFRELKVWEKAHRLTLTVYRETKAFPGEEIYGLASQLRRSAASIATNVAEGCGRGTERDFCRFLQMAMGSASETEYHLLIAQDLSYLGLATQHEMRDQITEIKRMLASLIKKVSADCCPLTADRF